MAFDNQYPNRKDWRLPYLRGGKGIDSQCRNHGGCHVCLGSRLHKHRRRAPVLDGDGLEFDPGPDYYNIILGERVRHFWEECDPDWAIGC